MAEFMKRKIYVETSVISYLTARPSKTIIGAAHQQITLAWWETRSQYELLVSESVLRECGAGDPEAAKKRLAVLSDVPLLLITEQALHIAESLVGHGIVPAKAAEDALHIANPEIQRDIAEYLEQIGLFLPFICTPEELLGEENAE
jgi:hypothetical protein